jgi:hypothetical protein
MRDHQKRETVSLEQMSYSNMLTINALVELLDERGILAKKDVLERITVLKARIQRQKQSESSPA